MDVTSKAIVGSTKFSSEMGSRAKGSMRLKVNAGVSYVPSVGSEIIHYDTVADEIAFGGVVYEITRDVRVDGSKFFDITFLDYCQFADRRRAYGSLSSTNSGAVVQWLLTNYLAEYGVTAGTIETGSTITEISYNGQSVTEALNELAKIDGFTWTIDTAKKLHYLSRESYAAPFNLSDSYNPVRSFQTTVTLDGFRNVQYFRGSANGLTDVRTEDYPGDSAKKEFAMRYKLYSVPTVKVNGVGKTVGISGIDSGKDWYWNKGSKILQQDDAGTVLTSSDTLSVTYRGYYPIFVKLEDGDSITQRAAAEGTSGVYEALDEDTSCLFLDMALDKTETYLRQNPWEKTDAKYVTDVPGLRAGMIQSINLTDYGISTTFLITSVEAEELAAEDFPLRYTVSGVSGEKAEDWLDFYRMLAQRSTYEVREDEVITQCGRVEATCVLSASVNVITKPQFVLDTSLLDGGDALW